MLRKLRRLRVPVCFYTCCSLCAILLFVSFNEDVKSLIQQNNHENGNPSLPNNFQPSFSSFSSSNGVRSRPVISSMTSGSFSSENKFGRFHRSEPKSWHQTQKFPNQEIEDDPLQQYIHDNFVGHPKPTAAPKEQRRQTTIVISNLVKLAQQASNNPDAFKNINSLTGDITNTLTADNELSPGFMDKQGSTSDTDLLYPGGDSNTPARKTERHWYMTGGEYFPTPPGGLASIFYPSASWLAASKPSNHHEYTNLWYDKYDGGDRIVEQLMFAMDDPINYANISWGFEGLTATTARPSFPILTSSDEPEVGSKRELDDKTSYLTSSNTANAHYNSVYSQNSIVSNQLSTSFSSNDRLIPSETTSISRDPRLGKIKTILLYYGLGMSWGSHVTTGRQVFLQQKCPVNACRLTGNRAQLSKADIVVFKDVFMHPKIKRPPNQLWAMYMLECPLNTQNFLEKNVFNLTATYRHDSDICTPYEKWAYFDDSVRSLPQAINYAEGKTKKVAWFVSNCVAKNNRLEYARELAKYIEVDIYGACGSHTCSRANAKQCFEMLSRNYKFYLAFENSNCRDYISEKFFVNGLGNSVLPITMGAHPDDYKRVAPDRSYIHVDDFSSPKELAQYLHELDTNDDLYNEYFKWKGTGEFINTHFFCRLCAMAHYAERTSKQPSHYEDFNRWWRGPHVCTRQSWRATPDIFAQENYDAVLSRH